MAILILVLIVASMTTLVSPLSNKIHLSSSKTGFQSTLNNFYSNKNLTKIELLRIATKRGKERMKIIEAKRSHVFESSSRIHDESSSKFFFMMLSIGTPKPSSPIFAAVIDTGSDPIWTQCKPCKHCVNQSTPIFDPRKSSSYYKVNCNSRMCKEFPFHDQSSCGKHGECTYKLMYADTTSTKGVLATETFTFEGNVSVKNLEFGCGFDNEGDFGPIPATIGLGRGKTSLVSQMNETKFSYCLPTYGSNKTGLLSIGSLAATPPCAKTTPLIQNSFIPNYYYISLQGITIGTTKLQIDKTKFELKKDGRGGLLVDSGTSLTYLEQSAFDQVKKELTRQLKLPSFNGISLKIELEVCYNMTRPKNKIKFPNIIFHFQGKGADFEVMRDNYFMFADEEEKVGCLMMGSSFLPDGLSLFGNYQQQNALLIYDLANNKLSFITNTNCAAAAN